MGSAGARQGLYWGFTMTLHCLKGLYVVCTCSLSSSMDPVTCMVQSSLWTLSPTTMVPSSTPSSRSVGSTNRCFLQKKKIIIRLYAYDIIISLHPHLGDIGLRVNAVVSDVPAADHKRVQGNGFCPQHGGAMTSMHKVYTK